MNNRNWIYDRRKYQRLKANITVWFKVESPFSLRMALGEQEIEASALNISEGGVALVTKHFIPLWSVITVRFVLFKTDNDGLVGFSDPICVVGEVRSSVSMDENEYRLGVCFKGLSIENKTEISHYVAASGS